MPEQAVDELFMLRPGVFRARTEQRQTYLLSSRSTQLLGPANPSQHAVLNRLAESPAGREDLRASLAEPGSGSGADITERGAEPVDLERLLGLLRDGGWLTVAVNDGDRELYRMVPVDVPGRADRHNSRAPDATRTPPAELTLSRFSLIRRRDTVDGVLTIESPVARYRIECRDPAVLAALADLSEGATPGSLSAGAFARLRHDLWEAGLAGSPEPSPRPIAQASAGNGGQGRSASAAHHWSAPELWFHHWSRDHRADHPFGITGWAQGEINPLPARPEAFPGHGYVDLPRPDLERVTGADAPLTTVVEARHSCREHGEPPITLEELGEFLFRCARNRGTVSVHGLEIASRPYPSGGALYELELYPVVWRVTGLSPGMYHYDGFGHRLQKVRGDTAPVRRLLASAMAATGAQSPEAATGGDEPALPQVLLVVAARFGRVMWKYEAMGYALILKNVGALYQTMYLVATAMGLAPVALGVGDPDAFAEATGLDPLSQGSVGEFLIGSRPVGDRRASPPPGAEVT